MVRFLVVDESFGGSLPAEGIHLVNGSGRCGDDPGFFWKGTFVRHAVLTLFQELRKVGRGKEYPSRFGVLERFVNPLIHEVYG